MHISYHRVLTNGPILVRFDTQRDTLQTLNICLPVYGPGVARSSARKLWGSLKLEIFQPTDPVTEGEALKTTQELIKVIYADNTSDPGADDDIDGLAREACEECIQILKEPEKSQAQPAIKVLCAFMSTTRNSHFPSFASLVLILY
jgi:DNA repair/transcription protein MET18/MMS19